MKRNSSRIWGRKITTDPTPPQTPSMSRLRNQESGSRARTHSAEVETMASVASMRGMAKVKTVWKTATTTAAKMSRPRHRMEQDGVEAPGPEGGSRRPVFRRVADLRRPLPAAADVLDHRQLQRHGDGQGPHQELPDGIGPLAGPGADQGDRSSDLLRHRVQIEASAAAPKRIGHVQDHEGRDSQAEYGSGESQVAPQVGGIEDQNDGVGTGDARHAAG